MDVGSTAIILLFSSIVGNLAQKKQQNCTDQEFEECLTALEAIAQRDDLALATTREELNAVCRKLQKGVHCIENHSFRCFSSSKKRLLKSVVSESRHVIDDLCLPGKLQEDYLRYAPCWKNLSTDDRKCSSQYRRLVDSHGQEAENEKGQNSQDGLKFHCCVFTEFVQCQYQHLLRDCGVQAKEFFHMHMDRMSGSLLNEHCAIYTHGSNACVFTSSGSKKAVPIGFLKRITQLVFFIVLNVTLLLIER